MSDIRTEDLDKDLALNEVATAAYKAFFDDNFRDLPANSIERAIWRQVAEAVIKVIKSNPYRREYYK